MHQDGNFFSVHNLKFTLHQSEKFYFNYDSASSHFLVILNLKCNDIDLQFLFEKLSFISFPLIKYAVNNIAS